MRRGYRKRSFPARVAPGRAIDERELDRRDGALLALVRREFERVARRSGEHLVCAPGCSDCCHGPFPVTRLDARRLRIGLEQLRVTNPGQANAIEARAGHAARKLTAGYPGDRKSGRLVADAGRLDRYFAGHATMACPVLDPASGRCGLYAARPMACRIYGPPSRFGSECAEACPLCFTDAGRELIESCRLEADRDDLEAELLRAMGVSETEPWETLIAFVLARPLPQA